MGIRPSRSAMKFYSLAAAALVLSTSISSCAGFVHPNILLTSNRRHASSMAQVSMVATSSPAFGDQMASFLVSSPLYPFMVSQARTTMKKSAEGVGIAWDSRVKELIEAKDWDAEIKKLLEENPVEVPEYYIRPFHAYKDGNLCWEAAFEQDLAGVAVGVRNFPADGANGMRKIRNLYEGCMSQLGVCVEEGGLIVDFGCGTGMSSNDLSAQFPKAGRVIGYDLSPHMICVGQYMQSTEPPRDGPQVELRYGDMAKTGLQDKSASLVSICLTIHELPSDARRSVFAEASRILKDGGTLSIMEMDPAAPGYVKLRQNPFLFSIIRSTEPYLSDYFSSAENMAQELHDAGFPVVRLAAATGRHKTVVAIKAGVSDLRPSDEERMAADEHLSSPFLKK